MEPQKKDNKKLVYGLSAFVFIVGGILLYSTSALVGAASVIIGLLAGWTAYRSS